jgi:hypothetical protein
VEDRGLPVVDVPVIRDRATDDQDEKPPEDPRHVDPSTPSDAWWWNFRVHPRTISRGDTTASEGRLEPPRVRYQRFELALISDPKA